MQLHYYFHANLLIDVQHIAKPMLKLFKTRPKFNWLHIESEDDLLHAISLRGKVALFKHSTRCSISSMAKNRLETSWNEETGNTPIYLLDLIRFRSISNKIESKLGVEHQSPQLILLNDGSVVYDASHHMIQSKEAASHI
ncbi:MAG: bacillithiol system protein YtxJ [Vicingaceae bacterium]